jgi:hypothetical protein
VEFVGNHFQWKAVGEQFARLLQHAGREPTGCGAESRFG